MPFALLTVFMMFSSSTLFAIECDKETLSALKPVLDVVNAIEDPTCPNPKKLRTLCMDVGSRDADPDAKGRFKYIYQKKLMQAACADPIKDSEEEIGKKIAKVWKENEDTLICNNTQFSVPNGSVIKYAVDMRFSEFIYDVVDWKINLNKVDETDGRTVLDYVEKEIKRFEGMETEKALKEYYHHLKKAGAKHKSEL
jgi:hypothetical protein